MSIIVSILVRSHIRVTFAVKDLGI
ncbi:unnamed protein product [Larinioides sclopetarius]|uniref:Uncharacterized protein n=1 Tax=Larinioides sclopetarius TaxID=280406 RepID=A0AAV1ZN55_9ARAC